MKKLISLVLAFSLTISIFITPTAYGITNNEQNVSGGGEHSMLIKKDNSLWTWGNNQYGQLGDGTTKNSTTPKKVIDDVISVSAGDNHSLALKKDGSLWSWGYNEYAQLGNGKYINNPNPVKILDDVVAISAGGNHSLAIKKDGSLWAWGQNFYAQLGDGTYNNSSTPKEIMDDVKSISAGANHSLAIKIDGSLWAWGYNFYAQIGDGTYNVNTTPKKIMDNAKEVSAGGNHSLAIMDDGSLWAWGYNSYAQIGDGTYKNSPSPKKIIDNVKAVSAGESHSIAVTNDETLYTWGSNTFGQLGDETYSNNTVPTKLMDNVTKISAGYNHSLIYKEGSLITFGRNNMAQLGDGAYLNSAKPKTIITENSSDDTNDTVTYTPTYIYNQYPKATELPVNRLKSVRNIETATNILTESIKDLTLLEKQNSVDTITLYTEEAIAQSAVQDIRSDVINVDYETAAKLADKALKTSKSLQDTLQDKQITLTRELKESIKFKTYSKEKVNVNIDKSIKDTDIDNIIFENSNYRLTIPVSILDNIKEESLTLTIEEKSNDTLVSYDVELNTEINGSGRIKLSLQRLKGDTSYQVIKRNSTELIGGKYNPITNQIEAYISESGQYSVEDNEVYFSDIYTMPIEMQEAIKVLASKGIINGYTPSTFNPQGSITRAEITALIVRAISKSNNNTVSFEDVKPSDWYYKPIATAKNEGIINGISETTFGPNQLIQKDQIIAIVARTLRNEMGYKLPENTDKYLNIYNDRSEFPSWLLSEAAMATRDNLVVKQSDNKLIPSQNMTRGDAAIIIYRMFNKLW